MIRSKAEKRALITLFTLLFSAKFAETSSISPDVDCNLSSRRSIPRKTTWTSVNEARVRGLLEFAGVEGRNLSIDPTRPLHSTSVFSRLPLNDPTP